MTKEKIEALCAGGFNNNNQDHHADSQLLIRLKVKTQTTDSRKANPREQLKNKARVKIQNRR